MKNIFLKDGVKMALSEYVDSFKSVQDLTLELLDLANDLKVQNDSVESVLYDSEFFGKPYLYSKS
jgi:hypothetical protein